MLTEKQITEALSCDGVEPTGPVSAWPRERNIQLHRQHQMQTDAARREWEKEEKADLKKMAGGVVKTALQAARNGKVSKEVREARMETCKGCEFFKPDSKRCSLCGCFMEAKTWIAGPKHNLCPKDRWSK